MGRQAPLGQGSGEIRDASLRVLEHVGPSAQLSPAFPEMFSVSQLLFANGGRNGECQCYCESGLQLCLAWGLGLGQPGTRLQQILGLWPAEDSTGGGTGWARLRATSATHSLRCWGTFAPLLSAFPADSKAVRVLAKF